MAIVTVEVDIDPTGAIVATPNPVFVASGDRLAFHIRTNQSEGKKLNVSFPGGTNSPFGARNTVVTIAARRCLSAGNGVNWPPGVNRSTVTLTISGSPVIATLEVEVVREENLRAAGEDRPAVCPQLVQNLYLAGTPIGRQGFADLTPIAVSGKSTDCGPTAVSAGPTWGTWENSEQQAVNSALARVRSACELQCHGDCGDGKRCVYSESRSAVPDIEEHVDENRNHTYRARATSEGSCQCE